MGQPLLHVKLDAEGAELSRESKEETNSKVSTVFIKTNIARTRLFHPAFSEKRNEWDSSHSHYVRGIGPTKGQLHYKKIGEKDGIVTVAVSGRLIFPRTDGNSAINAAGVQSYDTRQHVWIDGKLTLDGESKSTRPGVEGVYVGKVTQVFTLVSGPEAMKPAAP